jgi:ferredoxin
MLKLRKIRIAIAAVWFALFVCGFTNILGADAVHGVAHFQFVPALLFAATGMVLPLAVLLLLTLLFGRVYCSFLCPTGILQDISARAGRFFGKKKKRYRTEPPHGIVRYSLMGLTFLAWIIGFNAMLTLLDPYGIFGRIGNGILRPLIALGNNLLAMVFNAFGDYTFVSADIPFAGAASLTVAIAMFLIIVVLSYLKGRWYCNVICPVGTLLGLISKVSLFKITVNETACNKCLLCAAKCKSGCIDSKKGKIDYSRCVMCGNCIPACRQKALKIRWAYPKKYSDAGNIDVGKRTAIVAVGATAASAALASCSSKGVANTYPKSSEPIMPPGAVDRRHFQAHCTACHLCVAKCPSQCIKPSFLEYGIAGVLQPMMKYSVGSFCNYDCTVCSETCPTGALHPLPPDEKHDLQIGIAEFHRERCVVYTNGTDCGACSEHCPTQAVRMVPYKGGLRIPEVNTDLCLGCGGCQSICPVRPVQAITVSGTDVQKRLYIPKEEAAEEVVIEDFGF